MSRGIFDGRYIKHKLPVAKVKIRSPHFKYDNAVETEVAVCENVCMPSGIDCNIGNSLFRQNPKLTDVLTIRPLSFQRPPAENSTQKQTASNPQRQSAGAVSNDDQLTVARHPAGGNRVGTATTRKSARNLTRGDNDKTHLADERRKLRPTRKVVNDTAEQRAES